MKIATLTGIRKIEVREVDSPRIAGDGDVLLRVDVVGVCGSDVHYFKSGRIGSQVVQYPWPVGHEMAGTIEAVGAAVKGLAVGQRVAVDPLVWCGECDQCRIGRRHTCRNQKFLGCPGQLPGCLGERVVMPAASCFPVPDSMTFEQAALVEPLSIGLYAVKLSLGLAEQAEFSRPTDIRGRSCAVLGSGPIGLSVMLAWRALGGEGVFATDLLDERLAVAGRCGAQWTGNPRRVDVIEEIRRQRPGGLDIVFECAGQQETLDQGVAILQSGGKLMMVGIPEAASVSFIPDLMRRKELCLQNVRRQNECVREAIELVASGKINVDPLVTHRFGLDQTAEAFDLVADYRDGVVKAMVDVSGHPQK